MFETIAPVDAAAVKRREACGKTPVGPGVVHNLFARRHDLADILGDNVF